jgi:hypothetical protein
MDLIHRLIGLKERYSNIRKNVFFGRVQYFGFCNVRIAIGIGGTINEQCCGPDPDSVNS